MLSDDPAHIVVAKRSSRQKLDQQIVARRDRQQLSLQGTSRANPTCTSFLPADLNFCQAVSTASAASYQPFPSDSVTL